MRRAATLLEVTLVLSIAGMLAGLTLVPAARLYDAVQVRSATAAISAACALARQSAIGRSTHAMVLLDTVRATVTVVAGADTLHVERLGLRYGVDVSSTGPAVQYSPIGHGWGLSNVRVVARRGRAADTLVVSRLGRVRR